MKRRREPRIATVLGVDIRVHPMFLVLVAFLVLDGVIVGGDGVVDAAGWVVLLFGSVLVHELAHAVVGRAVGARVRDIILLPIGGATRTQAFPDRPSGELLMTAVGPATSFAIAGIAAVAGRILGVQLMPVDLHHGAVLGRVFWLNVVLGVFNLLPTFPMDGGRLLRAALTGPLGRVRATRVAATIGQSVALALGFIGLSGNLWLVIIAAFVFLAATGEARVVELEAALRPHTVAEAMTRHVVVADPSDGAADVARLAVAERADVVVVAGQGRVGVTDVARLAAVARQGPQATVGAVTCYDVPVFTPAERLDRGLHELSEAEAVAAPVLHEGRVVGALTIDALSRFPRLAQGRSATGALRNERSPQSRWAPPGSLVHHPT